MVSNTSPSPVHCLHPLEQVVAEGAVAVALPQLRLLAEPHPLPALLLERQLRAEDAVVLPVVVAEGAALQLRPGRRRPRPVCWC
jgi:hypothetical protein